MIIIIKNYYVKVLLLSYIVIIILTILSQYSIPNNSISGLESEFTKQTQPNSSPHFNQHESFLVETVYNVIKQATESNTIVVVAPTSTTTQGRRINYSGQRGKVGGRDLYL